MAPPPQAGGASLTGLAPVGKAPACGINADVPACFGSECTGLKTRTVLVTPSECAIHGVKTRFIGLKKGGFLGEKCWIP